MPELDGCGAVAAPATNATALNVIKGFINDAAKTLMKNQSLARLFGGVQARPVVYHNYYARTTRLNNNSSVFEPFTTSEKSRYFIFPSVGG